jgi:hypothetical protein
MFSVQKSNGRLHAGLGRAILKYKSAFYAMGNILNSNKNLTLVFCVSAVWKHGGAVLDTDDFLPSDHCSSGNHFLQQVSYLLMKGQFGNKLLTQCWVF